MALLSGMIADLVGEDVYETISGRMRSSKFNFYVNSENEKSHIEVKKPQIEIDGGFESTNKIIVVEAKNSQPEDFIIRQLYYPYRFWKMKVNKEIVPVFFTYKNGVYTFYIYKFKEDDNYSSIELVEKISYVIDYDNKHIIQKGELDMQTERKDIPFPQADTFNRVKEIIDLIADDYKTAKDIAGFYDIADRQGNYYMAAAKYLGLVEGRGTYTLTNLGWALLDMDLRSKNYELAKLILNHKPFLDVYDYYRQNNSFPDKNWIISCMRNAKVNIKDDETKKVVNRRASTVKGWVQWIINSGIELH